MKTALAISGGGSKGAFAVGAVETLRSEGIEFDIVSGTSTGALLAPMVALDDIERLAELYTSVRNKDIIRYNWRKLFWNAIYDSKPLENWINMTLSEDNRYDRLMESKCTILICGVSLQSKQTTYFSQNDSIDGTIKWNDKDELIRVILGSTNQPAIMPAQTIGGQQYVDGGVREINPLEALLQTEADRIIMISNSPEAESGANDKNYNNMATVGLRTIEIMSAEISKNDIRHFVKYNDLLKYVNEVQEEYELPGKQWPQSKEIIVIRPEQPLSFSGLEFIPEKMQEARMIGRATAQKVLDGLKV